VSLVRYAGGQLDRAAKLREDDDWVSAAFVSDAAAAVLMHNDQNLIAGLSDPGTPPRPGVVPLSVVRERLPSGAFPWVFLGLDGEVPVFGVELLDDALASIPEIADAGEFADLRRAGPLVSPADASTLAYARAMLTWHRRHRFCGACGSTTESQRAGHVRRCCDPDCAAESFPRTDPVVIMLVTRPVTTERPARVLLGRHGRLPRGAYSLLAGFVEPGESLEDAVAREVWEETGVRVRDVTYQASQPWPFPGSMMIGFHAVAEQEDLAIDRDELEDAQWFTAAEISGFGEWDDESAQFRRPRRDSIARWLLDRWVKEQT
jgi:NAD+ diphosphatase